MLICILQMKQPSPLAWLPLLDYSLLKMWQLRPRSLRDSIPVRHLFEELEIFVHSAAVAVFLTNRTRRTADPQNIRVCITYQEDLLLDNSDAS
jgi:hypothetical protein